MSSKIIITRQKNTFGFFRNIAIKIDKQKFGVIKNGETKIIEKDPGKHEVIVEVDFMKDLSYTLELKENETKELYVSYPKNSDTIMLIFLLGLISFVIISFTKITIPYINIIEFSVFSLPILQILYYVILKKGKFLKVEEKPR